MLDIFIWTGYNSKNIKSVLSTVNYRTHSQERLKLMDIGVRYVEKKCLF